MVGAGHDDAANASVIGRPEDVIRHLDVVLLIEKMIQRVWAAAAFVAEMHHRIHTLKVPGVFASIRIDQVEHHDVLDLLALAILLGDIDQDQIIPCTKGRQQLAGDIACRAGHQDFGGRHGLLLLSSQGRGSWLLQPSRGSGSLPGWTLANA